MKNVILVGQLKDSSGYGNAARSYFKTLNILHEQGEICLKIINFSFENNVTVSEADLEEMSKFDLLDSMKVHRHDITNLDNQRSRDIQSFMNQKKDYDVIFFLSSDWLAQHNYQSPPNTPSLFNLFGEAKNLFPCIVWETDKTPQIFLNAYEQYTNINTLICGCSWNAEVFQKDTGLNATVIPYSLDHKDKYDEGFYDNLLSAKGDKFAFCSVSQWGWRKGFDILLKSYLLEFYNDNVILFLKTYVNRAFANMDETDFFTSQVQGLKDSIAINGLHVDYKCKIVFINSMLSEEEVNSIYQASNCYVTCTRGEGFGLPIPEFSLLTSRPIIAPDKGGHIDFFADSNSLIDSRFEPCYIDSSMTKITSMYSTNMNIVESSINSTRKKLRMIYETHKNNIVEFENLGNNTRKHIASYLDRNRNIDLFRKVLRIENE